MNKKVFSLFLIINSILISCSTKDYFGQLSEKDIFQFQLEGQIGPTQIKGDTIYIKVSDDIYLTSITSLSASSIIVSDYAAISPQVGQKQNFSNPVTYIVSAEDGSTKEYYVVVSRSTISDLQLPNSNFNYWHDATYGETKYIEIGINPEEKIWASGNQGAAFAIALGAKAQLPTLPFELEEHNTFAAQLETQNMGSLAAAFGGKGIAAGNLFAGRFEIGNVTNAHPVFGLPYSQTPTSFRFEYIYNPAEGLLNGKLKPVEGKDAMDVYVILENRTNDEVKRLGVGWYRSEETVLDWTTKTVELKYAQGQAPEDIEEHATHVLKYGADGDPSVTNPSLMPEALWGDISKDKPTHILIVFTSSYQGDYFIGAPGSKLLINNFELIYE